MMIDSNTPIYSASHQRVSPLVIQIEPLHVCALVTFLKHSIVSTLSSIVLHSYIYFPVDGVVGEGRVLLLESLGDGHGGVPVALLDHCVVAEDRSRMYRTMWVGIGNECGVLNKNYTYYWDSSAQ